MISHTLIDKLNELKFTGIKAALEEQEEQQLQDMPFDERLLLLLDRELTLRKDKRLANNSSEQS